MEALINAYEHYILRLANAMVITNPTSQLERNLADIILEHIAVDNNSLAWGLLQEAGEGDGIHDKTFVNAAKYLIDKYEQR
jgi:hypothetical protein